MPRGPSPRRGAKSARPRKNLPQSKSRSVERLTADAPANSNDSPPASKLAAGLYIVATPIGHAADITIRALQVLNSADFIACENTRHTGKLLARYGITTRRTSYNDINAPRVRPRLLRLLQNGSTIALVCDAGTPLISDPGYRLVREAIATGISIIPIPGPSAPLAALVVSGLPSNRFLFVGFLPSTEAARVNTLHELCTLTSTLLFLESPRRLAATLRNMLDIFGEREVAVARELTKIHEEISRGLLTELTNKYRNQAAAGVIVRGEVVIVVAPPAKTQNDVLDQARIGEPDKLLGAALKSMGTKEAAETVARVTGLSRRKLYARALLLINARD